MNEKFNNLEKIIKTSEFNNKFNPKIKNFLELYPYIIRLQNKGASYKEITKILNDHMDTNFTTAQINYYCNKIKNKEIFKNYQEIKILSNIKDIPEYIYNKSCETEFQFRVIFANKNYEKYYITVEELNYITPVIDNEISIKFNATDKFLIKRFMHWWQYSDLSLINNEDSPAINLILEKIDQQFFKLYDDLYDKMSSNIKYANLNVKDLINE